MDDLQLDMMRGVDCVPLDHRCRRAAAAGSNVKSFTVTFEEQPRDAQIQSVSQALAGIGEVDDLHIVLCERVHAEAWPGVISLCKSVLVNSSQCRVTFKLHRSNFNDATMVGVPELIRNGLSGHLLAVCFVMYYVDDDDDGSKDEPLMTLGDQDFLCLHGKQFLKALAIELFGEMQTHVQNLQIPLAADEEHCTGYPYAEYVETARELEDMRHKINQEIFPLISALRGNMSRGAHYLGEIVDGSRLVHMIEDYRCCLAKTLRLWRSRPA